MTPRLSFWSTSDTSNIGGDVISFTNQKYVKSDSKSLVSEYVGTLNNDEYIEMEKQVRRYSHQVYSIRNLIEQ